MESRPGVIYLYFEAHNRTGPAMPFILRAFTLGDEVENVASCLGSVMHGDGRTWWFYEGIRPEDLQGRYGRGR